MNHQNWLCTYNAPSAELIHQQNWFISRNDTWLIILDVDIHNPSSPTYKLILVWTSDNQSLFWLINIDVYTYNVTPHTLLNPSTLLLTPSSLPPHSLLIPSSFPPHSLLVRKTCFVLNSYSINWWWWWLYTTAIIPLHDFKVCVTHRLWISDEMVINQQCKHDDFSGSTRYDW